MHDKGSPQGSFLCSYEVSAFCYSDLMNTFDSHTKYKNNEDIMNNNITNIIALIKLNKDVLKPNCIFKSHTWCVHVTE